jgi:hypothetical protein
MAHQRTAFGDDSGDLGVRDKADTGDVDGDRIARLDGALNV